MQIIPTILEKNFYQAENNILAIKDYFKWIQIDVIDGYFSFGKTFELELINKISQVENILWDVHLMVKEPKNWIKKCDHISASRIVGQVEMMTDKNYFIETIKDMGIEAGLAYDIDSEIDEIPSEVDLVLLLGRKSGFETKPFNKLVFEKVRKLIQIRQDNDLNFKIGVDGGVNEDNINRLKDEGVEIAYCGGSIFNGIVENNIKKINYASENK
jgi:ribulose-phosphate 3-epimerase